MDAYQFHAVLVNCDEGQFKVVEQAKLPSIGGMNRIQGAFLASYRAYIGDALNAQGKQILRRYGA